MEFNQVIGLIAAFLTTTAFVPQVIRTVRTRSTRDLSLGMFLMTFTGTCCWLIYGLLIGELPVILANTFTVAFSFILLFYKTREILFPKK
ncbi:MAG: SemiSWEET transporter [Bacteroidota bacterium]